jgi:hypothetical protein
VPCLEIEESIQGWVCRCRFEDGTVREIRSHAGSMAVARRTAAELAVGRVEGASLDALQALLAAV